MRNALFDFLINQNWMQILRALILSNKGRTLRELVDLTVMSPAGVQDILKRLLKNKIITARKKGNRIFYRINISEIEIQFLNKLFSDQRQILIRERSKKYSKLYPKAIAWIDETLEVYNK